MEIYMRHLFITAAALAAFSALPAHAVTIVNGGFENGTNPGGGFITVPGGNSTSITGWTVGGASVDYIGGYWQPQEGSRSVDLAGSGIGSISQDIMTEIGKRYLVTFWVARNPDSGIDPRTGFVDVGGPTTQYSFTNAPSTRANMKWQQKTYEFVASGANTTLRFSADPATSQNAFGLALDNVSIGVVPEPATWAMMIMGFGLIGGALRSRKAATVRFAAA
jgi:choice-of-anchor C domain-containing protein